MPTGGVVRPAQSVAEARHHPRRRQVSPDASACGQHGRQAYHADVRGRAHVQVVEVEDMRRGGPPCRLGQTNRPPDDGFLPRRHGDRYGVQQGPVGQLEVRGSRRQLDRPRGKRAGESGHKVNSTNRAGSRHKKTYGHLASKAARRQASL